MRFKKHFLIVGILIIAGTAIAILPPVRERLEWRYDALKVRLHYMINPPEEKAFIPNTPAAVEHKPATPTPASTETYAKTSQPTSTPTLSPTPLPDSALLNDVPYEHQHGLMNYCGPSNFSMVLTYWGWDGNREVVGDYVKPEERDKNVSPSDLAAYIENETDLELAIRFGGNPKIIKWLLANGYPILIEKGVYFYEVMTGRIGWMGHYNVVVGYDDNTGEFIVHDTFLEDGENHRFTYNELVDEWRPFNFIFMVIYLPEQEEKLMEILGEYADPETANQIAMATALEEKDTLTEFDRYFATFNLGTSLVNLGSYQEAASAFDESFIFYSTLPEEGRPWRMMWYQEGPYIAYFNVERYQDVVDLATQTLNTSSDPYLEESIYWRFKAEDALDR
jgi:hypothetical protein